MQLAYPTNGWWIALAAGVLALGVFALVRRAQALRHLGHVVTARHRTPILRFAIRGLAIAFIAIAILGPCWGERECPAPSVQGRDLIVVLDVSRSMLAEDATPNRLENARTHLQALAKHLEQQGGFRVALIAFAERPVLLCPLTTDYRHFQDELKDAGLLSVRLRSSAAPTGEGTRLAAALERALSLTPESDAQAKAHVDVLLVADGGDESKAELANVLQGFKERNVAVHALGVGDPVRGSPIPLTLPTGRRTLLQHAGQTVETRLEETPLKQIAEETKGMYLAARQGGKPLDRLLDELTAKTQREISPQATLTIPLHRFQWFLLPAVLLLVVENLLRAPRWLGRKANTATGRTSWLLRMVPPVKARRSEPFEATAKVGIP